jgi:hypothetical protein
MVNDYGQPLFVGARTDLSCSNTAMMVIRSSYVFVVVPGLLGLLLVAGCQNKGPTPNEAAPSASPAPVGTTETGGAHPATGAQDPHAGMGLQLEQQQQQDRHPVPDESGMMDVGAIAFKVPGKFALQQPKSSMRRAQLSASGAAGPADLIVYFFGPQGAGTTKDNIDRWVGQFTNPDGTPVSDAKQTSSKVSGFDVTKLEVAGQFTTGMGGPGQQDAPRAGQRLLAAIVETDGGPFYIKFIGPSATVAEHGAAFDALIASIVASP